MASEEPKNKSLFSAWLKVSALFAVLKILSSIVVDRGFFVEKSKEYLLDISFCFLLVGLIILVIYVVVKFMEKSKKGSE